MYRVTKKNGIVVILEPSTPSTFPLKQLFSLYFNYILPFIGNIISADASAYTYLPNSVKEFPNGKKFTEILKKTGFEKAKFFSLSFGIVSLYVAIK
jgi:demethylmenaquinone methyltransferase/2-methoxy-6-polyprenyl-1,4-benzoquinol methylase